MTGTFSLDRRSILSAMALMPFASCHAAPANTLQGVAAPASMLFGTAVRASQLFGDPLLNGMVARECGAITPEIELKWAYVEKARGQLDFADADRLAGFAAEHGKRMHGHALIWHESVPPWAAQALADRPDWNIVNRFLASVIPRYGAVTDTWDVVNEPVDASGPSGMRTSSFFKAFGAGYVRRALEDARLFAPKARLFINEYGVDYDNPADRAKRRALLSLLEGLKKSGAPLDGIGVQAHLDLAKFSDFSEKVLSDFFNALGDLGLEIRISELDVKEAETWLPVNERDRRVAEATRQYLDVALANGAVGTVACWGLSDRYSWLPAPSVAAGLNRGLPLDGDFRRKPMYDAIAQALTKSARRS